MKSSRFLILLIVSALNLQAQKYPKYDDLLEVNDKGVVKFYLDRVCKISRKSCAEYYLEAKINKEFFQFKDTIQVHYINNKLFLKGTYENGLRQGVFTWYFKDGKVQSKGQYELGNRIGVWEYYYSNGNLHKRVEYKNNVEYLITLLDKKGKELVKDGTGFFKEDVLLSNVNSLESRLEGDVVNGLPSGKWQISVSGTKVGTECFENNVLVKGISHSAVIGDSEFKDKSLISFGGYTSIEHLRLFGPSSCGDNYGMRPNSSYQNKLKVKYDSSELKKSISNAWFLVGIKSDYSGNVADVDICSNAEKNTIDQLKNMILEINMGKVKLNGLTPTGKYGYLFAPIVIFNNQLHFSSDQSIELLKYKY